jgi:mannosyltransferase
MAIGLRRRIEYPILLALILLAFGLRVYRLSSQSLWYDEAVTAQVASRGIVELTRWTADDIQPPLYYYVVAGWTRVAGQGEWALRFPSVFFGVLTVPLFWALASRLFAGGQVRRAAGLVAALLAAVSPVYVYYAQEARMYTQLVFLGSLAGYALLRAGQARGGSQSTGWWFAFVLAAAATLYTHYFGVFLLLAYGLCCLATWLIRGRRAPVLAAWRPAGKAALASLAVFALYLPWLPSMLNRYSVDRSYWQGSLKLGEALRHVAVSFSAGAPEMMQESAAVRLLPWFGVALGIAVLALLATLGRRDRRAGGTWCLLATLAVPLIAILALASRTPKFNARYLLMVSPAYLLLLAGGTGALLDWGNGYPRLGITVVRAARRLLGPCLAVAVIAFTTGVSYCSLHNWFTDKAFTKTQWREMVGSVSRRMAPDEAVVLVSGHAFPAWEYYAPSVPVVRLPNIDVLDVTRVLGFDAGTQLGPALAGKSGVWLVEWQADTMDPMGVVPYLLDRAGTEIPFNRGYWGLQVRHWQLRSGAQYLAVPQPEHEQAADFGHQVALLGWDQPQDGLIAVYWRALQGLDRDYQVSLRIEDLAGKEIPGQGWDGRPATYNYPTTRWRQGQAVFGRYPLPAGLPAAGYTITLAVYDSREPSGLDVMDVAGNPAGKRVRLGPLQ